jgi:phospholipid/cholesterol/gamma-HCH transport system ATP-binding protein
MTAESPIESPEAAASEMQPIIEVQNLFKEFGGRVVTNAVSFKVHRGDTLIIMGGSGCGKSTSLRQVIG